MNLPTRPAPATQICMRAVKSKFRASGNPPAFRALWVTALKAVLVVLPLVLPHVLALALGLYHRSWFLGVQLGQPTFLGFADASY